MSLEEIIQKMEEKTGYTKEQLYDKILKKQMELSGLVSLEGAAYLVARDLGLDLLEEVKKRKLDIANIVDGMRRVDVVGRVFFISEPVEFVRKDGSIGKVVNVYIADETGYVRVVLWDKQVRLVEDKIIEVGSVLRVKDAVAKETNFGIELRLGNRGSVEVLEDSGLELPSVEELSEKYQIQRAVARNYERKNIKELVEGPAEIRGFVVHVFQTDFVYSVCPVCNSRLNSDGVCEIHGKVAPRNLMVINCIVDDGTGHVRVVFFDALAEKLVGLSSQKVASLSLEERYRLITGSLLGKELIIQGVVKNNEVFERLEMSARKVKPVNVKKEAEMLVKELEVG